MRRKAHKRQGENGNPPRLQSTNDLVFCAPTIRLNAQKRKLTRQERSQAGALDRYPLKQNPAYSLPHKKISNQISTSKSISGLKISCLTLRVSVLASREAITAKGSRLMSTLARTISSRNLFV